MADVTHPDPESIRERIQFLEQELAEITAEQTAARRESARQALEREYAEKQAELERWKLAIDFGNDTTISGTNTAIGNTVVGDLVQNYQDGHINIRDGIVAGPMIGLNRGQLIVQQFFGHPTQADHVALLSAYLQGIIHEYQHLRLDRLTERSKTGNDQSLIPSTLTIQNVFTSLCCEASWIRLHEEPLNLKKHRKLRTFVDGHSPQHTTPHDVRWLQTTRTLDHGGDEYTVGWNIEGFPEVLDKALQLGARFSLLRPELVLESIAQHARLVLLGAPGAGKSTVLRYLAIALAEALLSHRTWIPIRGWRRGGHPLQIPIVCPLGDVATAVTQARSTNSSCDATRILWQVIEQIVEGKGETRKGLVPFIHGALQRGAVILFFDGLDELPVLDSKGQPLRTAIAAAIRALSFEVPHASIVVSSRTLPYKANEDWQLRDGWEIETIAPFQFGQVQHFIRAWYQSVAQDRDSGLTNDDAKIRSEHLIEALKANDRVRVLTESPLLTTMLVLVHLNKHRLPDDRGELYDACVELLLDRWETQRSWAQDYHQESLLSRLAIPHLTRETLRMELHAIAYEAHTLPPSNDGRGIVDLHRVEGRLIRLFQRLKIPTTEILDKQKMVLDALQTEAGLLHAISSEYFAFPHLTFQEYLAACFLVDDPMGIERSYAQWSTVDADRWREVLLLMMARIRQQGQAARLGVAWLNLLLQESIGKERKSRRQRERDSIFAMHCYEALGGRESLVSSTIDLDAFEHRLAEALVRVLHGETTLSVIDCRYAAVYLGRLGDPRYPVSIEEWKKAIKMAQIDDPDSYFCRIPQGTYIQRDPAGNPLQRWVLDDDLWIGRYPITYEQWQRWVEQGGYPTYLDVDARMSLQSKHCPQNAPAIGILWDQAQVFCQWLSQELGMTLRLPTEREWMAAAGGFDGAAYPWGAGDFDVSIDETRRIVPEYMAIGAYPHGQTSAGVHDLLGNCWEWCADPWFPEENAPEDSAPGYRIRKGGITLITMESSQENAFVSGSRYRNPSSHIQDAFPLIHGPLRSYTTGFRVVLSRLPHQSLPTDLGKQMLESYPIQEPFPRWTEKTIVIIEDEPDIRLFYERILRDEDRHVLSFGDPLEFIDTIPNLDGIGLILLNLNMPRMTGFELMVSPMLAASHPIPVIMITAYMTLETCERFMHFHGRSLIPFALCTMPFGVDHLLYTINQALRYKSLLDSERR